ncbi:EAL domain-containing protein [Bacterioplanoides sp. SCSIO 12839]|uniref:bifunctional diguanylate cyclase/phosphodiesterase n=1 Tax=Bacterioplanoides sp. SCSIO 12839 TaxID=2829569 RepID=UPI002102997F|nr:EAL domain-containing protein [Bacterioplanoides sp. SCSIO 12839]UTW49662.1 EAL domain-containing protein [Bacterioplanoides sp. SCSIO 12839]
MKYPGKTSIRRSIQSVGKHDERLLPLDLLIERCIKVFLTTRSEVLDTDLKVALTQLCVQLKADYSLFFISPDENHADSYMVESGVPAQVDYDVRILARNLSDWRELIADHRVRVLNPADSMTRSEQHIWQTMQPTSLLIVPVIGRQSEGGCLFFALSEAKDLSEAESSLLSTFAQLCYLVVDRTRVVDHLQRREQLLFRTERLAKIGSWRDDIINDRINLTPQAAEILELPAGTQSIRLARYIDYVHPEDRERFSTTLKNSYSTGEATEMIYRILLPSGNEKYIHGLGETIQNNHGITIARSGSIQDITDQQAKDRRLHQASVVFESTMEGIVITDASACIEAVNPAFTNITGYAEHEILGRPISVLKSGQYGRDFYHNMYAAIDNHGYWRGEIWNRKKSGELFPEWLTITAVRDGNQRVSHYVGVFSDMSKIKESEQQLEHLSFYDSLTNLPNRALLLNRLESALEKSHNSQNKLALIAIDLDHFKHINDSLGHPAGDRLLQAFSHRLRKRLRDSDTVARLGGDDFMVVLEGISNIDQAKSVVDIIQGLLKTPFDAGVGQELFISVSMGITLYPDHGNSVTQLLSNADVAMFRAKKHGRNGYQFYSNDMTQAASDRLELGNQLRKALQRDDELQLYYQPQVCINSGKVIGAEALMRWYHPTEGIISPGRFLPVAEDNGLMPELDGWALKSACKTISRWQSEQRELIQVAVNITQPTFVAGGLVELLEKLLQEYQILPGWLELEITEGALLEPTPQVLETIAGLKKLGVALAVDDFGTGYSSLAYLHRYQVDKLKIDRSFVNSIEHQDEGKVITTTIINMAKGLGLDVLAEGVETQQQLDFLRQNHCEIYQGFLFSKPLPVDDMETLMSEKLDL